MAATAGAQLRNHGDLLGHEEKLSKLGAEIERVKD